MTFDNEAEIAIHVSHLGKLYKIGNQKPYRSLTDTITNALSAPYRRLSCFRSVNHALDKSTPEKFWALKEVSFDVMQGEVIGIIGRNGAGKSTLLKILSRITTPTEGEVKIHGRVGSLLEVGTGFHPEMTGRENIFLNGSILGMKKVEIEQKFDDIVNFAEIDRFIDTPVKRYSSGMYVRLAFAVAAHMDTEILLVDEVLAVGDVAFQKKCLGKIGDVTTKEGRTVLFVSHNMNAVINLTPHCLWIDKGTIKMEGPSTEIVTKYLEEGYQKITQWKAERINNNPIQITSAEISSSSGFFDVTVDINIYIKYVIRQPVKNAVISAIIHASDGTSILGTEDIDTNPHLLEYRVPGEYCTKLCIPGNWISSGKYYLRLHSGQIYQSIFDNIEALSFELIETGNSRIRSHKQAYLLPYLPWTVKKI
jgi:lipopolysaccharide transport system ATP-binding protein